MVVYKELTMANQNDVELRKLTSGAVAELCRLLDSGDGWKQLMAVITVECKKGNPPKYTQEDVKLIESAGKCQNRYFTEILLEEWGTSGRNRPTVSYLIECLCEANLFRAADHVAVDILNGPPPERPPTGPAAPVQHPSTPTAPPYIAQPQFENTSTVVALPFALLERLTDRFDMVRRLGGGAGGTVYSAHSPHLGALAVKKLHDTNVLMGLQIDPLEQFRNEVNMLSNLFHDNLLPLVGYSLDGPSLCIVYEFMDNGSLLDRLATKNDKKGLAWRSRVEIGLGSARGLDYLHNHKEKPFIHRDIKSANILLDSNFIPKLGDFALARVGSRGMNTKSVAVTENAVGTSAYMAPEAYRGDVSVLLDIYSFGVVILELLTGLPPYDEKRDSRDLITHAEDTNDNNALLDMSAGEWPSAVATSLFQLANHCIMEKKKERPYICEVVDKLEKCLS